LVAILDAKRMKKMAGAAMRAGTETKEPARIK
jgi:hypothetical protein